MSLRLGFPQEQTEPRQLARSHRPRFISHTATEKDMKRKIPPHVHQKPRPPSKKKMLARSAKISDAARVDVPITLKKAPWEERENND